MDKKLKKARINIDVPHEIHQTIKIQATRCNITITKWLLRAIVEKLRQEGISDE